jgi:Na+/H+ antiporter NhaD/arsenite permease-like protein
VFARHENSAETFMHPGRLLFICCLLAFASPANAATVDGGALAGWWALPFAGMLLSIALLPLLAPRFWHHHFGKVAAGWSLAFVLPFAAQHGAGGTLQALSHTLLAEYMPFIVLLTALFTVSGGIYVRGNLHGSPGLNTGLLALGTLLASLMGTTGASMLLIRPLLRANDSRKHTTHVYVFFIFLVSNIGGSLTPLGDPPLFLGFLKGITFFWTAQQLWPETLFMVAALLLLFFALDSHWVRRESAQAMDPTTDAAVRFGLDGAINLLPLAAVVALVLLSGTWKPGVVFDVFGTEMALQDLVRDLALLAVTAVSLWITPRAVREANQFGWGPMQEVAKLFLGIFITMLPVLAMLKAGVDGPFAAVARSVTGADGQPLPWAYFWFAGVLSSFLDNAPTYLVFFNLAGGDPVTLMGPLASTLAAISAGAVFMGANSYIGNAPNFMVKAIVEDQGVAMPSFFGYMAWSCAILLPLFLLVTFIWMV